MSFNLGPVVLKQLRMFGLDPILSMSPEKVVTTKHPEPSGAKFASESPSRATCVTDGISSFTFIIPFDPSQDVRCEKTQLYDEAMVSAHQAIMTLGNAPISAMALNSALALTSECWRVGKTDVDER